METFGFVVVFAFLHFSNKTPLQTQKTIARAAENAAKYAGMLLFFAIVDIF
jgi:hypothetical protein